jgi:hypothetical protein
MDFSLVIPKIEIIILKQMKNLLFAALLILAGCATGSHVITGNVRPAISADGVKIYAVMPANAEIIGLVNSSNGSLTKQIGMNSVLEKIKSEAGKIGGNGVVITDQKNSQWSGAEISGTAIFVP